MALYALAASAASIESEAEVLYELGLLKGTGDSFSAESLELGRNATRAEVCTTIVRMLGKEEKAHYQQNGHPFNDVPQWASDYVGWLYENYLVNGVGDTYFGAQDIATVQQFATMLLRVLGYDDSEGDFSFADSVSFAQQKQLLSGDAAMRYELSRSDMIDMCYRALSANLNNSKRTLIDKLCDEGAVDSDKAKNIGVFAETTLSDSFADLPETLGEISVYRSGNAYVIEFEDEAEHYGLRVFAKADGSGTIREIPLSSGNVYFEKGEISYRSGQAAGYVSELYVYGLDFSKKYSFIVIKTTSESANYMTTGKSAVAEY